MPTSQKPLRVLLLQNRGEDLSILKKESERIGQRIEIQEVMNLIELEQSIKTKEWEVLIAEFQLQDFSVLDVLALVRRHNTEVPFVLIADGLGEETVADMMRAGVEDIILRTHPERLSSVLKRISREYESKAKEVDAQKIASEAFAAKEQMLAIVSHDIKNPLSAIRLEAQMLLRASDRAGRSLFAEEVKIQANRILKTTERMKILISDLLDRSKTECGLHQLHKSEVNFPRLIQEVIESIRPIANEKSLHFKTIISENLILFADRNKMFQVFSNLLSNSVKFSPPGETIRILAEETDDFFSFSIEDSGPGLSPDEINRVFDKFWTAGQHSGTGLGLFISKTIVDAHGGHIEVKNLPKRGARFHFTLPKQAKTSQLTFERLLTPGDQRKFVLIVDDDEDLREVIGWILEKEGFRIKAFGSPIRALEFVSKNNLRPDLVIVDFHMDELKGSEFVRHLNAIKDLRNIPVILITASPREAELSQERPLYREIITKPVDLEGLVNAVKKVLFSSDLWAEQSST